VKPSQHHTLIALYRCEVYLCFNGLEPAVSLQIQRIIDKDNQPITDHQPLQPHLLTLISCYLPGF